MRFGNGEHSVGKLCRKSATAIAFVLPLAVVSLAIRSYYVIDVISFQSSDSLHSLSSVQGSLYVTETSGLVRRSTSFSFDSIPVTLTTRAPPISSGPWVTLPDGTIHSVTDFGFHSRRGRDTWFFRLSLLLPLSGMRNRWSRGCPVTTC